MNSYIFKGADIFCGTVPRLKPGRVSPEPLQFNVTTVQPLWRHQRGHQFNEQCGAGAWRAKLRFFWSTEAAGLLSKTDFSTA